ncbi:hypothetical protein FSARC_11168 [Fusarium sarcochroum]|uniref:Transcription factor domain-containing protein n=1 Tax=Fusarium sarcochroum TaxID=1208366 RepID=A0A8H4X0Z9_9HYPO|nr:hypothetical protein FSARC_11168 [Fusarium sarcochroum]
MSLLQSCGMQLYATESPSQAAGIHEDFTARAEFCAQLLSSQSTSLAEMGFNVFIHHSQTLASTVLRDTFAASALHAVRNPSNSRFVNAEITQRAAQLVEAMQSESIGNDVAETDMLSSLQALLVYQCILLFSPGSISQQTQAERDNIVLQSWAVRLQLFKSPHGDSEIENTTWEAWVKQEAIRRTLICVELVTGTYTYLRGLWPVGVQCHHDLSFTAQRRLWEAKSATEWRLIYEDISFPSLPTNMLRLDSDLEHASPSDLDDIGVLLRVAGKGFDNLKEWLSRDRRALQRWGDVDLR